MFIVFLVALYGMGALSGANGEIDPAKWKAAHPYQEEKAPTNPAQIGGNLIPDDAVMTL